MWGYKCSLKYPACTGHAPYYIVVCGLPDCTIYFHNIPKKTTYSKTKLLNIKPVFWFLLQCLLEIFFILRRNEWNIFKNAYWSSRQVRIYSCSILMKLEFTKNTQISNFMNIRLVGAELFHADGRTHGWTDRTKLIVAIRNFANVRKKSKVLHHHAVGGLSYMHVKFPDFKLTDSRDNLYHNYSTRGRPNTICFATITNNKAGEQNRAAGKPTLLFWNFA
jgi:hypothetical protein